MFSSYLHFLLQSKGIQAKYGYSGADDMKRRQVITGLLALGAMGVMPSAVHQSSRLSSNQWLESTGSSVDIDPPLIDPINDREFRPYPSPESLKNNTSPVLATHSSDTLVEPIGVEPKGTPASAMVSDKLALPERIHTQTEKPVTVAKVNKNIDFARDYDDDIFLSDADMVLLHSVTLRLKNLQTTVGYGHFNILGFDDAIRFAKRFSDVGAFTPEELTFIEQVFFFNAADYGFYGEKVVSSLTSAIKKDQTFKVPHTGHYLFKEQSFAYYEKIRKSVGEGIILTSGIRSNVKQLHLFLAKAIRVNGNLSRASRSLAPPGYSFHGIGDFDVGRKGWGGKNFTDAFSSTDEFKRMQDLGYVSIRYDQGNQLGVRFEPWHIKVV